MFRQKVNCPKCKAIVFVMPAEPPAVPPPTPPEPPPVPLPPPVRKPDPVKVVFDAADVLAEPRPIRREPRPSAVVPQVRAKPPADVFAGPAKGYDSVHVQASARLLRLPPECCCCGRPTDGDHILASSVRVEGKRVIRTEAKGWTFPACRACVVHSRAGDKAIVARDSLVAMARRAGLQVLVGLPLSLILIGIPMLLTGIARLSLVVPMTLIFAGWRERRARSRTTARCACLGSAVVYHGWRGSLHHFEFRSRAYAESFQRSNGDKILG